MIAPAERFKEGGPQGAYWLMLLDPADAADRAGV